ncbi:MAG: Ig-like domain-containing protein [Thermoplasmata archaeon]
MKEDTIKALIAFDLKYPANAIAAAAESFGAEIHRIQDKGVGRIWVSVPASKYDRLAEISGVEAVETDSDPIEFLNLITTNTYMGHDAAQLGGFTGAGIMGEVQDGGCQVTHPDFSVDYTDGSVLAADHGTCTFGIVFSQGTNDMNAEGIIPDAVSVFADYVDNTQYNSVAHVWNGQFTSGNAGMNGVFQSNSWGHAPMDGTYLAYAEECDQSSYDYPKTLVLWAAGNSNSGVYKGSLSQEAVCKNGLTVGAIWHENTASMADDSWYSGGTGNTPSQGPTDDGRQKPDVIGPFDWIYCTDRTGTSGYSSTDYYNNFGGTSGATPIVAGIVGQAYQMYIENYFGNNPGGNTPDSTLIKSLLIADAYQYGLADSDRDSQGWGSVDAERIYTLGADYHVMEDGVSVAEGGTWSRQVFSDGSMPLKISMSWHDPAAPSTTGSGRALRNNLDLKVTAPGGIVYWGNNGLYTNLYSTSGTGVNSWTRGINGNWLDDENNVENVFIQTPTSGAYTIEVLGRSGDMASTPQKFSIVAAGAQDVSSMGSIDIQYAEYPREASVQVEVADTDLNTNPSSAQSVTINIKSNAEPSGESMTLTETGPDTSIFRGTKTISATNSAGVLQVNAADVITATYVDASPSATVTDTAIVDGVAPASPSGLSVEWYGLPSQTLITQDFTSTTFPPTGWAVQSSGTVGAWSRQTTTYAGGTSGEARYHYGTNGVGISRLYSSTAVDTTGMASLNLAFRYMLDDFGSYPLRVKVQTSSDGTNWHDTTWYIDCSSNQNIGPELVNLPINTVDLGSPTFRISFTADGNSYGLDNWYVDNIVLSYTGGGLNADNRLQWTLSADDGGGANDVDHYNIYRSSSSSGPWTTLAGTVPAGTATFVDSGRGEFDGTTWWYVVRAVDGLGNTDTNTVAVPEPGASGATATATGPTGGPTNVAGINILYSYTGSPTSVNLYYTTTGGTSWALAGNDASVNGNYAWTCPVAGTYGWLASAVGGASTEPSPPSGGTAPESSSYIYDNVVPTITATTFTDGATGVAITAGNYNADFSENMAVAGSVIHNLPVGTTFSWVDANTYRLSYPQLAYSTTYTLTYQTTFTDIATNPLGGNRVKTFTTGAAPAATATASGPTGGPTTVTAVTLTYTYTGIPTSVDLYYTKNTASPYTWVLAGSDTSVDGSFAHTITAGSGMYSWYARAIGGGSTETAPGTTTVPEAGTYIVDVTPPAAPIQLTVEHWGPGGGSQGDTTALPTANLAIGTGWATPANAYAVDSVDTTAGTNALRHSWYGYDFSTIPAGSTIDGIQVVLRNADSNRNGNSVDVAISWDSGTSWSASQNVVLPRNVATDLSTGGVASTWGHSWSLAEIQNSFRVSMTYNQVDKNGNVDAVQVTVYYTATGGTSLDHNTLNWTHSGADVAQYNIYRAEFEPGPYTLMDTVPVGTNTYVDMNMGMADATLWWYIVRAEDALGNEEQNNNAVQEPGGGYYDIDLTGRSAGDWAFLSFPVDVTGSIVDILDDAGGTDWDVAKWWDGTAQSWKTHRKGLIVNTFSTIDNKMGVWVHLTAVVGSKLTLGVAGDYSGANVEIQLRAGWNMVGYPSVTSRNADVALSGTGATIVSAYIATSPYVQDYTDLSSVTMSHGNAYWIHVPSDIIWTVLP